MTAGEVAEVVWAVSANHRGGYQYRLCPKPASGNYMDVTEKCFQQMPLPFVGDTLWLQEGVGGPRTPVAAERVSEGTFPAGSMWTKTGAWSKGKTRIVDLVQVPSNLPAGDYVISFRWDCVSTMQVWNQCGSVRIKGTESMV